MADNYNRIKSSLKMVLRPFWLWCGFCQSLCSSHSHQIKNQAKSGLGMDVICLSHMQYCGILAYRYDVRIWGFKMNKSSLSIRASSVDSGSETNSTMWANAPEMFNQRKAMLTGKQKDCTGGTCNDVQKLEESCSWPYGDTWAEWDKLAHNMAKTGRNTTF